MLAFAVLLILAVSAGLFSPRPRFPETREPAVQDKAAQERREAFIKFGQNYFAIAQKADRVNEQAFERLESMTRGSGSIQDVHAAFRKAAEANRAASAEFKALQVPMNLQSQSKLRQSLDTMSKAYDARGLACDILVEWNGDMNDRATAERYGRQVEEINRLTLEGLGYLREAADDNKLTKEDAQEFLPADVSCDSYEMRDGAFRADAIPWR